MFDFASTTNSDESDELLFRMRFRTAQYDAVILGSSGSTYVINGTAYTNAIFIQLLNGQLVVSLSVGIIRILFNIKSHK